MTESASQRAMADVEKVAKAIFRADDMAVKPGFAWGETTAASYRAMAVAAIDALGLVEEVNESVPVSVLELADDGTPLMDDRWVQPIQRRHFEWVAKRRLATPWEEVGERITSEELSVRLRKLNLP